MIAIVILGALSCVVFPGQVPRVGTMPLVGTAIGVTIIFAFVRSADALSKVFGYFAITCAVVFIACGAAAGIEAPAGACERESTQILQRTSGLIFWQCCIGGRTNDIERYASTARRSTVIEQDAAASAV